MNTPALLSLAIVATAAIAIIACGSDQSEQVQFVDESTLPTPSIRRSQAQPTPTTPPPADSAADIQPTQTDPQTTEPQGQTRGRRETRGLAPGIPSGGDPQELQRAIEQAIQSNPELQELTQRAQTGDLAPEDFQRLRELMEEAFENAGVEFGPGLGGGQPPVDGAIIALTESQITLQTPDSSTPETDIAVDDQTSIQIISLLSISDLAVGDFINAIAQRGEGGVNTALTISLADDTQQQRRGGFGGGAGAGLRLGGTGGNPGNPAAASPVDGEIVDIEQTQISVETDRGTLRLAIDQDTRIVSTKLGSISDLAEGMAVIAFGIDPSQVTPARNIIAGPPQLLNLNPQ